MVFRARLGLAALAALSLAACQNQPTCPPKGPCEPTVEGSGGNAYTDFDAAKRAFTRTTKDNTLSATLEDVAWLRFEGDEETIVKKHRAYFQQGYTTFEMTSLTKDFVQPTGEMFVLTDSAGARATARPATYQASMGQEQERYAARFTVSFRHAITRDLAWVRLTRQTDGQTLEWAFPGGSGAPVAAVPEGAVPPPATDFTTERTARAEPLSPLLHPRNPAPGACEGAPARPVNLLTHPEAAPPARSAVPPPAAPAPKPAEPPPPDGLGLPPTGALPPPDARDPRAKTR